MGNTGLRHLRLLWTTARKRMDLINRSGSVRASVRETDRSSPHASVSHMLHACECCGRVVRNRIGPGCAYFFYTTV